MIAGDAIPKLLNLETAAGVAQSYADKAAFQAAGWDLDWFDVDGVLLTSQPTWTIADQGAGIHLVNYEVPAGIWWVEITAPDGYRSDPAAWGGEGEAYDNDSVAGLIQTSQGIPLVTSADDGDLGDVVMGDSWATGTQTIPLGKLTALGYAYADLTSGWTISAGLKSAPTDTMVSSGVTCAFVSAAAGTFSAGWTTFPTGLNLSSTAEQKTWYMDIQLKRTSSSTIITSNRYRVRVVWERNTTT